MSEANVQVVRQVYAAMQSGNFAQMFSLISPDVKIWQSEELPWGGSYEGLEEARAFFGKVTTHLKPAVALERFIDSGDFVVALARTQGSAIATGKTFDVPLMHLWEVHDLKITGLKVFLENEKMQRALAQ